MLTNNFYRILDSYFGRKQAIDVGFVTTSGGSFNQSYNAGLFASVPGIYSLPTVQTAIKDGVVFGDSDIAPTVEDITLKGQVVTGITVTINNTYDENGRASILFVITNPTNESKTIKEICWFYNPSFLRADSSNSTGASCLLLIDRTVLDEPVTIPAGGIGQVVYTITFNYPTAATEAN